MGKEGGRVEVEQVEGLQGAGYGPEKPHHRGWTLIPPHFPKYLASSSPLNPTLPGPSSSWKPFHTLPEELRFSFLSVPIWSPLEQS